MVCDRFTFSIGKLFGWKSNKNNYKKKKERSKRRNQGGRREGRSESRAYKIVSYGSRDFAGEKRSSKPESQQINSRIELTRVFGNNK